MKPVSVFAAIGLAVLVGALVLAVRQEAPAAPSPPRASQYIEKVLRYQREQDAHQPDGAVVFLGDSLTQGLATAAVAPLAINYGIGHQDTAGLLAALPSYGSLHRARVVVLMIGTNDLSRGTPGLPERLRAIRDAIPAPLVWHAIPPSSRFDPAEANATIRALCAERPDCTFAETDFAPADFYDGTHLTPDGYRKLIATLRQTVGATDL